MKRLLLFLTGVMLLTAGECSGPAELKFPISEPGVATYDPRLVGAWYRIYENPEDGLSSETLYIQPHPNGFLLADYGFTQLAPEDRRNGLALLWVRRTAYASVVGGKTYYNSRLVDAFNFSKDAGARPTFREYPASNFLLADWFTPHPERGYWIFRAELNGEDRLVLNYLSVNDLENKGFSERVVSCGKGCSFSTFDLSSADLAGLIRDAAPDDLFNETFFLFGRLEEIWPPELND